jgi:RHS repeat-associated protein
MGSATNGSAQVISVPKGGGALHGIGEKFSPDLFTGTGNFTVSIALPPGRNGFQPQLSLVYSTGHGNGPFGLGWSLTVPGVTRKTSNGVPRYDDARDAFILSGVEDLVPVEKAESTTQYRPRTEGLFALIHHHHDAVDDYWEVQSKDGLVSLYGTKRPQNASPDWNDPAVVTIGATNLSYAYDSNGNLISETGSRHFEWDHADRMRVYRTRTGAEPTIHAHYLYDAAGQRVKKVVRKAGHLEVTVYIEGIFEHSVLDSGVPIEQNLVHVMDNQKRMAIARVGPAFPGEKLPITRFELADHLNSSNVIVDNTGQAVNRGEYKSYGETSFGSATRKRYRFTGKERDEESGLAYHGARDYEPWTAKWVGCEQHIDGLNPYVYVGNNPLRFIDPSGFNAEETPKGSREYKPSEIHATGTVNWETERSKHTSAAARKKGVSGGPYQQHHHADIKAAANARLSPKIAGEPERMSTVHSRRDPIVFGNIEGKKGQLTHHNVAKAIDKAEQARGPATAEGLIDASATSKQRWPATADPSERAKHLWRPEPPKGPPVNPETGVVAREAETGAASASRKVSRKLGGLSA